MPWWKLGRERKTRANFVLSSTNCFSSRASPACFAVLRFDRLQSVWISLLTVPLLIFELSEWTHFLHSCPGNRTCWISGLSSEKERELYRKTGRRPNDIDVIQTDKQLFAFYECEPKIWTVLVCIDESQLPVSNHTRNMLHSSGHWK